MESKCPICGGKIKLIGVGSEHNVERFSKLFMFSCSECELQSREVKVTVTITDTGTIEQDKAELIKLAREWGVTLDE